MIPSIMAARFREGLKDYMETSYPIASPVFEQSLSEFLSRKDAFFHEPYVSVKLPFRVATHGNERFEAIHSDYSPYVHQNRAFDRLVGKDPKSTLVATGTGSGKTECFLYPLLEYCYHHKKKGEKGIKALIIYPMNALASDQAKRFAEEIWKSPELRGLVTVGMFVGGVSATDTKGMSEHMVITDHQTLLDNPPDILMTNYKELDYLLVQPRNAALWADNTDPDTLRFVVVDELHTFDGAQGTDLACLLRRVKARLNSELLCCIGTSATMGGGGSAGKLREYAHRVFAEEFDDDSVITEDRLSSQEFFLEQEVSIFAVPSVEDALKLAELAEAENEEEYIRLAVSCWMDEEHKILDPLSDDGRVSLAERLMHHTFFQSMIGALRGRIMQPSELCDDLSNVYPVLQTEQGKVILDSMLALISHARQRDIKGKLCPFLHVQVQVWMRELRRVRAKVDPENAELMLERDLNQAMVDHHVHYLPVINCHDCGATGWVGMDDGTNRIDVRESNVFYNKYFDQDKRIRMLFPRREDENVSPNLGTTYQARYCPECLYVQGDRGKPECEDCGHDTVPVWLVNPEVDSHSKNYICPFCGGNHSLIFIGMQTATAISAGLSQIYGSRFNDDKKLLAFNDNVQDASHRAGFFNARTWRFVQRTAMQHFVRDGGEGLPLSTFGNALNEYWLPKLGEETWVDTFITHDMIADNCYESLQLTGKFSSKSAKNRLISDLSRRIAYETVLEYGISSRIGRTLEKNRSSMLSAPLDQIRAAAEKALLRIVNEAGVDGLDEKAMVGYMLNLVQHMRTQGAFALEDYRTYVKVGAIGPVLAKYKPWMSKAMYKTPLFPSNSEQGEFEFLNGKCWYVRKMEQALGKTQVEAPGIVQAVGILFEELEKSKVLVRMEGPKGSWAFGLNPELFMVTSRVSAMRCSVCKQVINVPEEQTEAWEGSVCCRAGCSGVYHVETALPNCFASLYENGDLVRIHAKEHTGQLERGEREALEIAFKHKAEEHKSWDPNLLSCTPTLEMGIDIGDLSTVVLCSVPPSQANYVQRAGRAGRKDGNAFTVAVAGSKEHDLYFFQEPMDMISGQVDPPDVFLDASAVLERQFIAFCFDNWVRSGVPETAVPQKLENVLSKFSPKVTNPVGFPFDFLKYVNDYQYKLIQLFGKMFGADELKKDSRKRIEAFAKGEGLEVEGMESRILKAFRRQYDDREALNVNMRKLRDAIKKIKETEPQDASNDAKIADLEQERLGLRSLIESINRLNTYEFMSEEGLLPNYAFPEAGVNLKAILERMVPVENEDGSHRYAKKTYTKEYSRAAASAITEFAPDNSFYANGHKLQINQVDVSREEEAESWRFCPDCNWMERVLSTEVQLKCPHCESERWADQEQVRTMRKVRTVYANGKYEDTVIGDDSDNRTVRYYANQMIVNIEEETDVEFGYQTKEGELPFGFDYVRKATMREVNFGESDNFGRRMTVAGREEVRNGFVICKYCGMIQPKQDFRERKHTSICKAKTIGLKDPFEECMFLYREFSSEAIRILMPSTSMDTSSEKVESFSAAIMLGMKKKFGNVDHLRFCMMDEPSKQGNYRDRFMVIYDSVPGGTGYLKQLAATPDGMMDVFEKALFAMEHCSCKAQDKDGCYHCLFAYRQSNRINNISRKTATELLRKILTGKDSIEKIKSVRYVDTVALFDSELEKLFIEALQKKTKQNYTVSITPKPVNGKLGFFMTVNGCSWKIELQRYLDDALGIPVYSKADFIFWPSSSGKKQRPVIVFTDGFRFHKEAIAEDTNKRLAVRDTCNNPVWSLSYWDVVGHPPGAQEPEKYEALNAERMPGEKDFERVLQKNHLNDWKMKNQSSFDLLMRYLADDLADEHFATYASALAVGMLEQARSKDAGEFDQWKQEFVPFRQLRAGDPEPAYGKAVFGSWSPAEHVNVSSFLPISAVSMKKTQDGTPVLVFDETKTSVLCTIDEGAFADDKALLASWNQYLYCTNMLQFVPKHVMVSRKGLEEDLYAWYAEKHSMPEESFDPAWEEVMEDILDPDCKAFAEKLRRERKKAPSTIGLEDEKGYVIAEMVWEEDKIAVILPYQEEFRDQLVSDGWTVFSLQDDGLTEAIKELPV